MELQEALDWFMPNVKDGLLKMAGIRRRSDCSVLDMGVDDAVNVLEAAGGDPKALRNMALALCGDSPLALDYFGPFGEFPGYYEWKSYTKYDLRRRSDIFVITDTDGLPSGIIPTEFQVDFYDDAYGVLKDTGCTAITDRTFYSRELIHGLERSVKDYLIVQVPFPISYSSTRYASMQDLRHNGRHLKTCKIRYDKRWLFRFTDPLEAEEIRSRIPYMGVHRNEIENLNISAGATDVISNVGYDIREVRRLLDIRERMDSEMRRHRRLLGNDADILSDDAVIGFMLMSVISTRLTLTDP